MNKQTFLMVFLAFVALLVAGSYVLSPEIWGGRKEAHADRPPLRIALNVWPGYAHAFIAQEKGFFAKNGVNVALTLHKEHHQSVEQYKNGQADGILDVFSSTITHHTEGIKTKVVYVADYSQSGDVIVGRSSFSSLADLKTHTVSFEKLNSFSHIYVLKALENSGLTDGAVQFEIVPAQEVLTALESGRIDAGHTWEPTLSQALEKGYKILSKAGDIPGIITDVLAFREDVIEQRPQDVQAVVQSMLDARAFLHAHQEEGIAIMATAEGISREEMASGLAGVLQPDLSGNIAAMTPSDISTSLYHSGAFIGNYLLKRGQLNHILDLDKIIDGRFVRAVRSEYRP